MFRFFFHVKRCFLVWLAGCAAVGANPHALRHVHLAELAMRDQEPELARRHLELALQHDPREVRALSALGVLYYLEGELRKAAWFFEEAVRVRPDFPEAHANWGALLLAEGKLDAALKRLATALYHDPGNDAARWNLALAYLKKRDYRRAAVHLGWYCARTGHPPHAVRAWMASLHAAGEHQKARQVEARYLGRRFF